ncbi:hypothetical protein C0Q70_04902 [Pomacea canaliculata]|uniref:Uncharacterized protein n=1 Tax=Pomacea canaliculata TaxID=400727 RepID=A0A2T7PJR7_POMCA|nr:hypothetical protein C0Q70_04902 [Pomacea canaliculata]
MRQTILVDINAFNTVGRICSPAASPLHQGAKRLRFEACSGLHRTDVSFVAMVSQLLMSLCAGLVVAVQDHEHFRLKLVYSRKKKIQNSLRETEVKLQLFRAQCCALKRLCINEGVEEAKIEQIVQLDEYVVNKTGKSKCKVKIDNSSVILLDKSDFPRLSPRPSLSCLVEKKRGTPVEGGKDGKSDKSPKKGALKDSPGRRDTLALICSDDSDKNHMRMPLSLFHNGPRKKRWNLLGLGRDGTVKRAGSFSQICQNPPHLDGLGFLTAHGPNGKVKRAGSHSLLCGGTLGQLNVSMDERDEDDVSSLALAASSPDESPFLIDKLFQGGLKANSHDLAHPLSEAALPPSPPYRETPTQALHQGDSSGSFNPNLLQAPEFCDTFANVSGDKVHDIEKTPNLPQADKADPRCETHEELDNAGDGTKLETHPSVFDRGKGIDCGVQTGDQQEAEGQVTFALNENEVSEVCKYFQQDETTGNCFEVASCQEAEEGTHSEERIHPSACSHPLSELCGDSDGTTQPSGVDLPSVEDSVREDHPLEDEKSREDEHDMLEGVFIYSHPAEEETAPSEDDRSLHPAWEPLPFEEDHARNSCPEAGQPELDVTSVTSEGTRTQNGCRVSSTESVDQVIQTNGLPHMYK